jgi:hypothetical protein
MNKLTIATLALLIPATPALAAETDVIRKLDPAWQAMEQRVTPLVGQTGQRTLLDMAYAQVAVDACPGLALNAKAFDAAFGKLAGGLKKDAAEQRKFENKLMAEFGTYTGLVLAESFLDKPAFCQAVEGIKTRKGGPAQFWTAK